VEARRATSIDRRDDSRIARRAEARPRKDRRQLRSARGAGSLDVSVEPLVSLLPLFIEPLLPLFVAPLSELVAPLLPLLPLLSMLPLDVLPPLLSVVPGDDDVPFASLVPGAWLRMSVEPPVPEFAAPGLVAAALSAGAALVEPPSVVPALLLPPVCAYAKPIAPTMAAAATAPLSVLDLFIVCSCRFNEAAGLRTRVGDAGFGPAVG
jgi:hypothetical protein